MRLALFATMILCAPLHAELAGLSYHEQLNSDLVVFGKLENVHREVHGDVEMNTGTVRVQRVFKGKAGETVDIFWTNDVHMACRISHERFAGLDTLWFLKQVANGPYDANNILRALPVARETIHNFVEYFEKWHGAPDTPAEKTIYAWIRQQDERLQ